jgi:hypothetical protein
MWDNFHRAWILLGFLALVAGCTSCSVFGGGESDADTVDDMARNCKHGMKRGAINRDDDESEIVVDCMPGYGI